MILRHVIIFASALFMKCTGLPTNNSAVLITKYAKVAHWGVTSSPTTEQSQSEGRSNSGQMLWAHRTDANIRSHNPRPSIVYQYPIQKKPSKKVGEAKSEVLPAVGEVQERFNPRPYFDYVHAPSKSSNGNGGSKSEVTLPPSFDSFPVFSNPPPNPPSPSVDPYTSSYSSYNPPKVPDSPSPSDLSIPYPPNGHPQPPSPPSESDGNNGDNGDNGDSYKAPDASDDDDGGSPADMSDSDFKGYFYDRPKHVNPHLDEPTKPVPAPAPAPAPTYPTLGPPLAPKNPHHHHHHHSHDEQLYYPPEEDGMHPEVILDHPPPGYEEPKQTMNSMMNGNGGNMASMSHMGAPADMAGMDASPDQGMAPPAPDNGHDMAEQDLSPPVAPSGDSYEGKFPSYLYNGPQGNGHDFGSYFDHDHHHVYKEVTTTTTTEMPEEKRVNKGHYSYYYLGRKLWYIPLYFSVYFILYVTVLILKSIARHKIQFKHEHFTRKAKEVDLDRIDDVHRNVTVAIDNTRRRIGYIAM